MKRTFTKYPSGYVKASVFLPFGDANNITKYAMDDLDKGKPVYLESGALNDVIIGYVIEQGADRGWTKDYDTVYFTTELGLFGERVNLNDFSNVDYEEFDGKLFIQVS